MFRILAACILAACAALLIAARPHAADVPPTAPEAAARIEAMVNRAAALVEAEGAAAFAAFRERGSPWRFEDVYLFVFDLDGRVLLNVEFPHREGTNRLKERDADGKLFHEDFIAVVRRDGSG